MYGLQWCCYFIFHEGAFSVQPAFDMVMLVILKETEHKYLIKEFVFEGYCGAFTIVGVLENEFRFILTSLQFLILESFLCLTVGLKSCLLDTTKLSSSHNF